MKDSELRGIVLKGFYDRRREGFSSPNSLASDGTAKSEEEILDIGRVCDQLAEHGLLDWKPIRMRGHTVAGMGMITAQGVDAIEEKVSPLGFTIKFDQSTHTHVTNSSGVQIGTGNTQGNITVDRIISAINGSQASNEEKAEARSLVEKCFDNPLVKAILGRLMGTQ